MVATIIGGGMFALPVAFVHVVFKRPAGPFGDRY
jgi:hypothetical protein